MNTRVVLVQWAGDYRAAYRRLIERGEKETYYAQRHSVETAGELARAYDLYAVLCLTSDVVYNETMPNGVRALGAGINPARPDFGQAFRQLAALSPTHLVVTTPRPELIAWGTSRGITVIAQFADTFTLTTSGLSLVKKIVRSVKHSYRTRRLANVLNHQGVRVVGNHNLNASRDLVRIGVSAEKVVPWDWPPQVRPDTYDAKTLRTSGPWQLVYVGSVEPSKGVGDAITAVATLNARGHDARLQVIGRGDLELFQQQAAREGVVDKVDISGGRSHDDVLTAMRDADVVLVPSWHAYPEGLPMTIYETMAVRTPLVCSDHPAFRSRVGDGVSAVVVPERTPTALADGVEHVMRDAARYAHMSEATADTWRGLLCPVTFYELLRRAVSFTGDDAAFLRDHSIGSHRYD